MMSGNRQVVITGGAGFLGSHLTDALLAKGCRVTIVDNLSTGRLDNIQRHLATGRVTFIKHDVTTPFDVAADEIYNLACPASPPHYQADPVQTAKTCALGALNVLALAQKYGARVLQASTSEVYGDPQVHPQPEAYWGHVNPAGIRSCYDEGKRFAETLFADHARLGLADVRIARIFNTYGPRMRADDGRVVSNFITQALRGAPLTVYGDGQQTRSFCYVDDLIAGLTGLMAADLSGTQPVNIGNPAEFTVLELAQGVIAQTRSQSQIVRHPLPGDDPRQRQPDITLARKLFGWAPTVALADGLSRTIAHFTSELAVAA